MSFNITASDGTICTKHSNANVAIYITRSQYTTINLGENDLEFFADPGDWVDLGLPSGLLRATRNVGATSPEDYGDYFAWGETTPKSVYDLDTYIYFGYGYMYYGDDYYRYHGYTKYCADHLFGIVDDLGILEPGDDAATANYGGRTPTREEWEELINNTEAQWTT